MKQSKHINKKDETIGLIVFCFGAALLIGLFITMILVNCHGTMTDVTINR